MAPPAEDEEHQRARRPARRRRGRRPASPGGAPAARPRRPASGPTKPSPKRADGSPATAQPVGSTRPDHRPAAMAPPVRRTSPRPAGDRPSCPGCQAAGRPSTVWPGSASTSRWPPCSTHARRASRVDAGSRAELVGRGRDGAHRAQAGRGLGQLGRADGGEAGGAGVDREGGRPGHAPSAEGARQQPHQLLADRALQDAVAGGEVVRPVPQAGLDRRPPRRSGTTATRARRRGTPWCCRRAPRRARSPPCRRPP